MLLEKRDKDEDEDEEFRFTLHYENIYYARLVNVFPLEPFQSGDSTSCLALSYLIYFYFPLNRPLIGPNAQIPHAPLTSANSKGNKCTRKLRQ